MDSTKLAERLQSELKRRYGDRADQLLSEAYLFVVEREASCEGSVETLIDDAIAHAVTVSNGEVRRPDVAAWRPILSQPLVPAPQSQLIADATDGSATSVELARMPEVLAIMLERDPNKTSLFWTYREYWKRRDIDGVRAAVIAAEFGVTPSAVRTGIMRFLDQVRAVIDEHGLVPDHRAPMNGLTIPRPLERARGLWLAGEVDGLASELGGLADRWSEHPYWLRLSGWVSYRRGDHPRAIKRYRDALVWEQDSTARALLYTDWGIVEDELENSNRAVMLWKLARDLAPMLPCTHMNLIRAACVHRTASAQEKRLLLHVSLTKLGDQRSRLPREAWKEIREFLENEPLLGWGRKQSIWMRTVVTWMRNDDRPVAEQSFEEPTATQYQTRSTGKPKRTEES